MDFQEGATYEGRVMNHTEELTVIPNETLGSLER